LFKDYAMEYKEPKCLALREKYKHLLTKCFDFSIGDGWCKLMEEFLIAFEKETKAIKERQRSPKPTPEIVQVKQKLGGLRIYLDKTVDSNLEDLIQKAERKATKRCEDCGGCGKKTNVGAYVLVACDTCKKAREVYRERRDEEFKQFQEAKKKDENAKYRASDPLAELEEIRKEIENE